MTAGAWPDRLRFMLRGRWLLSSVLRRVTSLPQAANRAQIAAAQRAGAQQLLAHFRVDLRIHRDTPWPTTPGLVIALHEGMADALCLSALPLPLRFVARQEIFEWPGIGPMMRRCGHIAIEPEQGAGAYRQLMREARVALAQGDHVVIFPQGTLLGIQTAFLPGAFRLAKQLAVPILPIVLTGTHRIWEHPFDARVRYGQSASLQVLPPISQQEVRSSDAEQLRLRLQRAMKRAALAQAHAPPRHYLPERDGRWPGFRFELDPEWAGAIRRSVAPSASDHSRAPCRSRSTARR